jgi:hypothetical protein
MTCIIGKDTLSLNKGLLRHSLLYERKYWFELCHVYNFNNCHPHLSYVSFWFDPLIYSHKIIKIPESITRIFHSLFPSLLAPGLKRKQSSEEEFLGNSRAFLKCPRAFAYCKCMCTLFIQKYFYSDRSIKIYGKLFTKVIFKITRPGNYVVTL